LTNSPTTTSALVYALRRDSELQSTRRRALETVAEERARLGRDLHDSIAPLLAGAGLTAEALRKGMTPDTPTSRTPSGSLPACGTPPPRSDGSRMTCNPSSGQSGLEAALADYIATLEAPEMPQIRLHAEVAESLPTAVEQGAYLVVLEALNNVVGHAHAKHCEVS
jgi:signal transduction histidine kinase